jgi:hypothetical protein
MRWTLILTAPLMLLPFAAGIGSAQQPDPHVTITFPDQYYSITAVRLTNMTDSMFVPVPRTVVQYRVDDPAGTPVEIPYNSSREVYRVEVDYWHAAQPNPDNPQGGGHFEIARVDTCDGAELARIACSVVRSGSTVTCAGIYHAKTLPPEKCEGTYACTKCDGVKVCGSSAQCF